jgi:hypothetical protein
MSVNVAIPYNRFVADGVVTTFTFDWDLIETADLIVLVDNVLQIEYSDYTVTPDFEDGGDVVFELPPADQAQVVVMRRTTISQNVDYESYTAFPADTHEWNIDKITYILQELIHGTWLGYDDGGNPVYLTFDLNAVAQVTTVLIENSGGTDATIPPWVSAELAGVYHGETVPVAEVPADESVTTKPDGYIWLGIN